MPQRTTRSGIVGSNWNMKMYTLLFVSLAIVALPRFNRSDWGFIRDLSGKDEYSYETAEGLVYRDLPRDVAQYMEYVDFLRGRRQEPPSAPFSYRPFVPLVASLLPLEPMSAINIVNMMMLGIGLVFFRLALMDFGNSHRASFIGCFIFILSFPTFFYSTIGFVDGSLMGVLLTGMIFVSRNKPIALVGLTLPGILVKETAVILLPVAVILAFQHHGKQSAEIHSVATKSKVRVAMTILGSFFVVGCYMVLRQIAPGDSRNFWLPSFQTLLGNLVNVRMYVTLLLTLGIPAVLAYLGVRRVILSGERLSRFLPLAVGASMSMLLYLYSILSAHADGRFLWTSYPFLIPMALPLFDCGSIRELRAPA
jgi:hypothetical protein